MKDEALLAYCERVEREFFRFKGRTGTLSPADWARVEAWYRSEVPLEAALAAFPLSVLHQSNPFGGRSDPFLEEDPPQKGVHEGALSRVELPRDHQEKQLVELADGGVEGQGVSLFDRGPLERQSALGERASLTGEDLLLAAAQDSGKAHRRPRKLSQ